MSFTTKLTARRKDTMDRVYLMFNTCTIQLGPSKIMFYSPDTFILTSPTHHMHILPDKILVKSIRNNAEHIWNINECVTSQQDYDLCKSILRAIDRVTLAMSVHIKLI